MDVIGDRRFVELPGEGKHELPPLFIREHPRVPRLDKAVQMARELIEKEELIPNVLLDSIAAPVEVESRKMDLALNMVEQYLTLVDHWQWGDSILEWIRQCEVTFGTRPGLRGLMRPDVWPHAGRSSFVTLLDDKHVPHPRVKLDEAVGLRLTFRQPPPLACFSDQFLFYLNSSVATSAYRTWAMMSPEPVSALPPERFTFELVKM